MKKTFQVEVMCGDSGTAHEHLVVVSSGDSAVRFSSKPQTVRLQYVCPEDHATRIVAFMPPRGFARPFDIVSVSDGH